MVTSFKTVQELMSSCNSSELKGLVSHVLTTNKYINWKLTSCSVDGDRCSSDFEATTNNSDRKYHLSYVVTPTGEHYSYSVI